jgi:hypothetical protein
MLHPFLLSSISDSSQALAMQSACTDRTGIPFMSAPFTTGKSCFREMPQT